MRAGGALLLVALALLAAWIIWQPLRSLHADDAALGPCSRATAAAALTDARTAASSDPVDDHAPARPRPRSTRGLGQPGQARSELVKATSLQPENPDTWHGAGHLRLGATTGAAAGPHEPSWPTRVA